MSGGQATQEQTRQILDLLAEGLTREEVANRLGYKNHKSLDQFMRRRGYTWNPAQGTYLQRGEKKTGRYQTTSRALEVIAQFQKSNADAKEIAKRLHFTNHYEMAKYMQARGYVWSSEAGNYIARNGAPTLPAIPEAREQEEDQSNREVIDPGDYLHILGLLVKNEDKLVRW